MKRKSKSVLTAAFLIVAAQAAWARPDGAAGGQPANPPANPPTAPQANAKDVAAAQYIKDAQAQASKQADADAKTAIKKLIEIWKDKEVTDGTKKPIPDLLERYAKDGSPSVAIDAIYGFAELGPAAGSPPVLGILDRTLRGKDPSPDIYKACFIALKRLADPKASTVKALEDCLKHRMDDVVANAVDAISGYKSAPGKVRRELFEELIKEFEGVFNASTDPKKSGQVHKWQVVGGPVVSAMNALSGQTFKDPAQARQWFNDHKTDSKAWN